MNPRLAAMLSLGVLGGIDTYLTATVIPVPVWVTFIAWASFFACGGGAKGFVKSIASNFTGIVIASCALVAIGLSPTNPAFSAVFVGLGTAAMILASAVPLLSFPPAIVFGFASTVGTMVATGKTIFQPGLTHPALVAAAAMLIGAAFGLVSEWGTTVLTAKNQRPVAA
jgi:hypothetical protein